MTRQKRGKPQHAVREVSALPGDVHVPLIARVIRSAYLLLDLCSKTSSFLIKDTIFIQMDMTTTIIHAEKRFFTRNHSTMKKYLLHPQSQ